MSNQCVMKLCNINEILMAVSNIVVMESMKINV